MKSVLISIQPYYCDLIEKGEKTIEIRKNVPKTLEPPFICYLYETKSNKLFDRKGGRGTGRQKIIGEFLCDEVYEYSDGDLDRDATSIEEQSCVSISNIKAYKHGREKAYGWHISKYKAYDKQKTLFDFGFVAPPFSWGYVSIDL